MCVRVCVYKYIYIYIYIERERERDNVLLSYIGLYYSIL